MANEISCNNVIDMLDIINGKEVHVVEKLFFGLSGWNRSIDKIKNDISNAKNISITDGLLPGHILLIETETDSYYAKIKSEFISQLKKTA